MPDSCRQDLNQCSLQVWQRNSFPHRGVTQSVTFSNGATLTCTSNGANTRRSCTMTGTPAGGGDNQAAGSPTTNNAVLAAQNALFRSGDYQGPLDGDPNRDMSDAISQYQRTQGLPTTGVLDDATRARLGLETSPASKAALAAESALFRSGEYQGPLDGDPNRDLSDAIRQYQRAQGLPVTGVLDDPTRAHLGLETTPTYKAALAEQTALFRSGEYLGPLDGDPNRDMSDALRQYQRGQGLPVTGVLDDATRAHLGLSTSPTYKAALAAQSALFRAGYYTGPLDGDPNRNLSDAISQYQRAQGLPLSGVLDSATRIRLGLDTPASNPVLAAENALFRAGDYMGPLDGDPNRDMSDAIRTFQRAQGLPITGALDDATRARLRLPR
jgi:peptidoglycan hydrolase-like protein with peptidoglycan-binding domain